MSFRENLEHETVKDLPIRQAILGRPDMSLREAVQAMRAGSLGCLVIVDKNETPVGLFTEQHLLDILATYGSIDDRQLADCVTAEFPVVDSSQPIRRVWDAIAQQGERFLCVVDDTGKLLGITGQRGLSEYMSEHYPEQVMVQRLGSKPWMQQREGA